MTIDEIEKAIAAHAAWKIRLLGAIRDGKLDVSPATIKMDNQCAFGKWLYASTIPPAIINSAHYKKVKEHHAEFHKAAARVAELAVAGKKKEAEQLMRAGGEYTLVSSKLTMAMLEWKNSL